MRLYWSYFRSIPCSLLLVLSHCLPLSDSPTMSECYLCQHSRSVCRIGHTVSTLLSMPTPSEAPSGRSGKSFKFRYMTLMVKNHASLSAWVSPTRLIAQTSVLPQVTSDPVDRSDSFFCYSHLPSHKEVSYTLNGHTRIPLCMGHPTFI